MMKKTGLVHVGWMLFLSVVLLSGLAPRSARAGVKDVRTIEDTRVIMSFVEPKFNLPQSTDNFSDTTKNLAGLGAVALLAEGIIDKGFDLLSASLNIAAGKVAKADKTIATAGVLCAKVKEKNMLVDPNKYKDTITIVHGMFGDKGQQHSLAPPFTKDFHSFDERLIMQLEVQYSTDGTAFRLVPTLLVFNGGLSDSTKISMALNVTFKLPAKPTAKEETTAFGGTMMELRDLRKITTLDSDALKGKETAWIPVPVVSAGSNNLGLVRTPVVVEVQLVETRKPNKLLQLMADAFAEKKEAMAQQVNSGITISTSD